MGSLARLQVCIGLALLGADGIVVPCLFQLLQAMVILPYSEPASYLRAPQAASLGLSMSCLYPTCKDPVVVLGHLDNPESCPHLKADWSVNLVPPGPII